MQQLRRRRHAAGREPHHHVGQRAERGAEEEEELGDCERVGRFVFELRHQQQREEGRRCHCLESSLPGLAVDAAIVLRVGTKLAASSCRRRRRRRRAELGAERVYEGDGDRGEDGEPDVAQGNVEQQHVGDDHDDGRVSADPGVGRACGEDERGRRQWRRRRPLNRGEFVDLDDHKGDADYNLGYTGYPLLVSFASVQYKRDLEVVVGAEQSARRRDDP